MRVSFVSLLLVLMSVAGCLSPTPGAACTPVSLVEDGVEFFSTFEAQGGGFIQRTGVGEGQGDPRVTAWVLIAGRLADRAGPVAVAFDGRDDADWLKKRLPSMMQEGTGVDSVANNVSLVRAALQAWGHPTHLVSLEDPDRPEVTTLKEAWDARFNGTSGSYGDRLNEHLFAGFAARIFDHDLDLLERMGQAAAAANDTKDGGLYTRDAWFAAYARALLGPDPVDEEFALWLDGILAERQQDDGGMAGFEGSGRSDASTTAAALLAWGAQGKDLGDPLVEPALDWLCGLQQEDGGVPFAADDAAWTVKTTAEVVIAVSLLLEPIDWPHPHPGEGTS